MRRFSLSLQRTLLIICIALDGLLFDRSFVCLFVGLFVFLFVCLFVVWSFVHSLSCRTGRVVSGTNAKARKGLGLFIYRHSHLCCLSVLIRVLCANKNSDIILHARGRAPAQRYSYSRSKQPAAHTGLQSAKVIQTQHQKPGKIHCLQTEQTS